MTISRKTFGEVPLVSRENNKHSCYPEDHVFLVFFDIDQKYDLIYAFNNRWPAYLSNGDKLGLQHEDKIEYKTGHPSVTHSGEILSQGQVNVVSKTASLINDRLLEESEESEKLTADLPDLSIDLDSVLDDNCCHCCNRWNEDEEETINTQVCSLGGASRQSFNFKIWKFAARFRFRS